MDIPSCFTRVGDFTETHVFFDPRKPLAMVVDDSFHLVQERMQRPPRSVNRGELEETKWGCERSRVSIKLVDQDIDFHIFRYFRHKVTMYLPSFTTLDGRDRHLSRQPCLGRRGALNLPSGRSPHGAVNLVDHLASRT